MIARKLKVRIGPGCGLEGRHRGMGEIGGETPGEQFFFSKEECFGIVDGWQSLNGRLLTGDHEGSFGTGVEAVLDGDGELFLGISEVSLVVEDDCFGGIEEAVA